MTMHLIKHARGGLTTADTFAAAVDVVDETYGAFDVEHLLGGDADLVICRSRSTGMLVCVVVDVGDDLVSAERLHEARAEWAAHVKAQRGEIVQLKEEIEQRREVQPW